MKYTLIVTGSPYSKENAITAYLFAKNLIKMQHKLCCVFFFANGVLHSNITNTQKNIVFNLTDQWSTLSVNFQVKLYICINSALTRGLLVNKSDKNNFFVQTGSFFKLVGLGVLIKNMQQCDRVIQL